MRIVVALVLLLAGWAICRAQDTGYRVKVVLASGQRMEARFVTIPEDLRLICKGDSKGMFAGDYVKVELKDNVFTVGKMSCTEVAWVH